MLKLHENLETSKFESRALLHGVSGLQTRVFFTAPPWDSPHPAVSTSRAGRGNTGDFFPAPPVSSHEQLQNMVGLGMQRLKSCWIGFNFLGKVGELADKFPFLQFGICFRTGFLVHVDIDYIHGGTWIHVCMCLQKDPHVWTKDDICRAQRTERTFEYVYKFNKRLKSSLQIIWCYILVVGYWNRPPRTHIYVRVP